MRSIFISIAALTSFSAAFAGVGAGGGGVGLPLRSLISLSCQSVTTEAEPFQSSGVINFKIITKTETLGVETPYEIIKIGNRLLKMKVSGNRFSLDEFNVTYELSGSTGAVLSGGSSVNLNSDRSLKFGLNGSIPGVLSLTILCRESESPPESNSLH